MVQGSQSGLSRVAAPFSCVHPSRGVNVDQQHQRRREKCFLLSRPFDEKNLFFEEEENFLGKLFLELIGGTDVIKLLLLNSSEGGMNLALKGLA